MWNRLCILSAAVAILAGRPSAAQACPFCSAVSLTFAQEIAQSEAAVIGRLVEPPAAASLGPRADGPLPKGRFQVVEVLKGSELVDAAGLTGPDGRPVETILLEDKPVGTTFLLLGVEPPDLVWSSPIQLSELAIEYIRALDGLAEKGPDRLAFFQAYLEHADESLARDAYDEFAIAPYEDVRGLKDRMDPTKLLAWIEDPKVQANRRRLYATMLGVCGAPADAARIGVILAGGDGVEPEVRTGLDALIACYVALEGPAALDLVDRLFLDRTAADGTPRNVPFTETYAAVMALRFLGEESDLVPRERVLESLRILLDEPKLADLVIADLARWQDWSVVDRLVEIFKAAQADNIFVREPIVNYLRACPLPEAQARIAELEAIDPDAVRRAATLAGVAGLVAGGGNTVPADPEGASAAGLQVAPVLVDDEATDAVPGREVAVANPDPEASDPGRAWNWRWLLWAGIVLAVALASHRVLRPAPGAERPARAASPPPASRAS